VNKVFACKFLKPDAFAFRKGMAAVNDADKSFGLDGLIGVTNTVNCPGDKAKVELPIVQMMQLVRGDRMAELKINIGLTVLKVAKHTGEHPGNGHISVAYAQRADLAQMNAPGVFDGFLKSVQDALAAGQKCAARLGDLDHSVTSVKKRDAQFALEVLHSPAEGGLRNAKSFCRTAKMQFFRDGDEAAQMPQINSHDARKLSNVTILILYLKDRICQAEEKTRTNKEKPMKHFALKSVTTSVMALAISATSALAADITMNLGFGAPEESLYGRFGKIFEAKAEEYTNGSVDVKLRCCNQISSEDEAFKAMQLGTVDGFFITGNNVSPHWPLMDVTVLPYIFQNADHLERVVDGEVGSFMKQKLQKDTSVHLLSFGPALYRDFYNSVRPINTMADMDGLKIRTPKNEVMLATFEAFGANPVPLAWSETPTALQTGTVDGGDNGTSFIKDMKFYEFEPHLVILEHFVSMAPLFASDNFMKKLSDEQREQILRAATDAGIEMRNQVATETEDVRNWLVNEGGMKMTRPDLTDFVEAAKGVQNEFAEKRGADFVELVGKIQAAAE